MLSAAHRRHLLELFSPRRRSIRSELKWRRMPSLWRIWKHWDYPEGRTKTKNKRWLTRCCPCRPFRTFSALLFLVFNDRYRQWFSFCSEGPSSHYIGGEGTLSRRWSPYTNNPEKLNNRMSHEVSVYLFVIKSHLNSASLIGLYPIPASGSTVRLKLPSLMDFQWIWIHSCLIPLFCT